jgi:glucose-1-phosphate thymidylyltransferase
MKGIIMAGGQGSRLFPVTHGISKQLVPIYDKPLIYYPLSVLMLAGIKEVLIITTPHEQDGFKRTLGDGSQLGMKIEYASQESANGIAAAFIIGENFIGNDDVCLILGDNIFWGHGFSYVLTDVAKNLKGAKVFGYRVTDPERFGVIEFDDEMTAISIEEKPVKPKSNYAVTGLYFYDASVVDIAKSLKPSNRGELEITDINREYLSKGDLSVEILGRGFAWLDTGTHQAMHQAASFVEVMQKRTGFHIACVEEIAFNNGWISSTDLKKTASKYKSSSYGKYLLDLVQ